jgi:hypothetical protein
VYAFKNLVVWKKITRIHCKDWLVYAVYKEIISVDTDNRTKYVNAGSSRWLRRKAVSEVQTARARSAMELACLSLSLLVSRESGHILSDTRHLDILD